MDIAGSVVIVTGASSGIGAATARAVSARGGLPVLAARRRERVEALAAELPGALAVPCDVTDAEQVRVLVDTAVAAHGRVDVLVNNAGQGMEVPVERIDPDDLRALLELNLLAPLVLMQAVLPTCGGGGSGAS